MTFNGYVIAAYGLVILTFCAYALHLRARRRALREELGRAAGRT